MNKNPSSPVVLCLSSLLLLLNTFVLPAAEVPKPPYVKFPPPGTVWSVDIKTNGSESAGNETASAPAGPKMKISVPIKTTCRFGTNGIQLFQTAYSDGARDEYYVIKRQLLRMYPGTKKVAVLSAPYPFPGLEWVGAGGTYIGEEEVEKRSCHKFKVTEAYLLAIPLDPGTKYYAWIDMATGYPVQAQMDDVLYRFSPVTPYAENVELPSAYTAALKKAEQQQRALEVMRAQNAR